MAMTKTALRRRRALMLGALALLLLAALAAFLLRTTPAPAAQAGTPWRFEAGEDPVFAACGNTLLAASSTGLTALGADGGALLRESFALETPALAVCGGHAAVWDAGGSALRLWTGRALTALEGEGTLLSAAPNEAGWLVTVAQQAGCKGLVTVYDDAGEAVYAWYAGSAWPLAARLSPDCARLAVLAAGEDGGQVRLFALDSEDEQGAFTAPGALLYDLRWLDDGRLCALGRTGAWFLDAAGQVLGSYDYGGLALADYAFGEGFAVLALGEYLSGGAARLVSLDARGETLGELELEAAPLALDAAGGRAAALYADGRAVAYDERLRPRGEAEAGGALGLALRQDGRALLLYADRAQPVAF